METQVLDHEKIVVQAPSTVTISENILASYKEISSLLKSASQNLREGNTAEAILNLGAATSVFEEKINSELFQLITLAERKVESKDIPGARALLKELKSLFSVIPQSIAKEYGRIVAEMTLAEGKELVEDGNWQRGLETLRRALGEFSKLDDLNGKARTFIEIGDTQTLFGDYEMAKLSYLDAERFFKKLGGEGGIAVVKMKLGTLALEIYNYEEARKYLRIASDYFHKHDDKKRAELSDKFLKLADEYERELALV